MAWRARSALGLALIPLLLATCALGPAQGSFPRRALQQAWAAASASASALSGGSSSASASAYSSAGSASATSLADNLQTAFAGLQQQSQKGYQQQQQQQASNGFNSLLDSVTGFNSGGGSSDGGQQQAQQGSQQQQQVSQPQQQQQVQAAPSTTASSGLASFAQQTLDRHNYYRARHASTPALRWSSSLESDAQAWANRCVFEHSNQASQGENIAWGYPDTNSVIDAYYAEGAGYAYGASQPGDWHSVGHFTQIVWVSTTDLGCAVASCSNGQIFHVCRYYPAGNVQGQYASNVKPLISS